MTTTLAPPQALPTTTVAPFLSVLVPVRNEERFIADTLAQLLAQDYPADRYEILVADGMSDDRTRDIVSSLAARHPNIRLIDNPRRWSSAGRNEAVRASKGDILVLIDGHCQIDNVRYFADLAEAFSTSGADCVGRPQPLDVRDASALQQAIAAGRSSPLGHHPASHIYSDRPGFVPPQSVAVAYRREVFDRLGEFDDSFDACEDVEFNHRVSRAGMTCWFTPKAAVRYVPRDSLARLYKQMIRYGRGRVRLLRKHPETFSAPGFLPAAFLAGVVLGPAVCLAVPMLWAVYLGILGIYVGVVGAVSVITSLRHRRLSFLALLPAVFFAVHFGAATGIWWEALAGRPAERA